MTFPLTGATLEEMALAVEGAGVAAVPGAGS